ncbi:hypothetical protein EVA_12588 [gut metagenome]|uniref:Uncharacterized protein n=1 Tax=gut metagenome TaxID=749906 RepID=J9FWC6_9ZZZZ
MPTVRNTPHGPLFSTMRSGPPHCRITWFMHWPKIWKRIHYGWVPVRP